jgi:sec-independent protein translocase protein TatA
MSTPLPALAFLSMNGGEMFFVMFLCLLMFGSKKLPELAKAMGQSMREFKKAANEVDDVPRPPSPPPAPAAPLEARPAQPSEKL